MTHDHPWVSARAVAWVIHEAPVPADLAFTLTVIAAACDEHGRGSRQSVATIAQLTGKSPKQARRDITRLRELGLLLLGDQSLVEHLPPGQRPVVYDVPLHVSGPKPAKESKNPSGLKKAPGMDAGGGMDAPPPMDGTPPMHAPATTPMDGRGTPPMEGPPTPPMDGSRTTLKNNPLNNPENNPRNSSSTLADARVGDAHASPRDNGDHDFNTLYQAAHRLTDQQLRNALLDLERRRPRIYRECRQNAIARLQEIRPDLLDGPQAARNTDLVSYGFALQHYQPRWPAWLLEPLQEVM